MKLTKRGKLWYVDFTNVEGRRQRLSTGQSDEKLARVRAAELMHEHMVGQLDAGERKTLGTHLTLSAVLQRHFQDHWCKQAGGKDRRYQIIQLSKEIGHWPIHSITYAKLRDFATKLETEHKNAPATINRKLSLIKTALTECVKRAELQGMPVFPFFAEDNQKDRFVTLDEERKILAWFEENTAPNDDAGWYFRDFFIVCIDTGLRSSEALGLLPERIVRGHVVLPHGKPGKGNGDRRDRTKSGKGRTVPLTARAQAAVERLLANPIHRTFDPNWASHRFGRYMDKVGIPDVGIHTLRHTCASRLIQNGIDLYIVSKWLGHASMKVTERYAHLVVENFAPAVGVLEQLQAGVPTESKTFPLPPAQTKDAGTHQRLN